jgi:hypothetical protein
MLNPNRFYVYTYSYLDGIPFYVGKGTGNRHREHLHNSKRNSKAKSWCVKVVKGLLSKGEQPIIKKIVDNIDNEFACLIEQEYISKYGRRDINTGILVNCTAGGDGIKDMSPKQREYHGEILKRVGVKTRFVKGQPAWNKGKKLSEEQLAFYKESTKGKFDNRVPWNKGIKLTEEQKAKQFNLKEHVKKHGPWNKGLKMNKIKENQIV